MADKITYNDIQKIVSIAKTQAANQTLPMVISNSNANEVAHHVAMIESVIMFLNSKGLLTELPKIDHKERL